MAQESLETLMEKPLTDLSADDIARLPPQTSGWVTQWLYDFRRERFFELYPQPIGTATAPVAREDGGASNP